MVEQQDIQDVVDTELHQKTYKAFTRFLTWVVIVTVLGLIFLALLNA